MDLNHVVFTVVELFLSRPKKVAALAELVQSITLLQPVDIPQSTFGPLIFRTAFITMLIDILSLSSVEKMHNFLLYVHYCI